MVGELLRILPLKRSRNGNSYIRIEFLVDGKWAKTDICPDYRNYKRWTGILKAEPGTIVKGLSYKNESRSEINADSYPSIIANYVKSED